MDELYGETPEQRLKRLKEEGRLGEFNVKRKELVEKGCSEELAYRVASREVMPLEWEKEEEESPDPTVPDPPKEVVIQPTLVEDVLWVADSLGTKIRKTDAPSPSAWNMYQSYNKTDDTKREFFKTIFKDLIKRAHAKEEINRFRDTGESVFELIRQFPGHRDAGKLRSAGILP